MTPGRRALSLYHQAGIPARLQTRLRWWWCPVPAVDAEVPSDARVLEVGCGHGLVSFYLALSAPDRRVVGIDIDADKIAAARAAAAGLAPGEAEVRFETVQSGEVPAGPWDAVVTVDVLYLLPPEDQRRLLAAMAGSLAPGGVIVLKESGLRPRWKFRWSRFQETLATRVLGITESAGAGLAFTAPEELAAWLASTGLEASHRPIHAGYAWPHHLVVGRRHPEPN